MWVGGISSRSAPALQPSQGQICNGSVSLPVTASRSRCASCVHPTAGFGHWYCPPTCPNPSHRPKRLWEVTSPSHLCWCVSILSLPLGYMNLFLEGSRGSLFRWSSVLPVRKTSEHLVPALALQITTGPTQLVRRSIAAWFQKSLHCATVH